MKFQNPRSFQILNIEKSFHQQTKEIAKYPKQKIRILLSVFLILYGFNGKTQVDDIFPKREITPTQQQLNYQQMVTSQFLVLLIEMSIFLIKWERFYGILKLIIGLKL